MYYTSFKSSIYLVKLLISQYKPVLVVPQKCALPFWKGFQSGVNTKYSYCFIFDFKVPENGVRYLKRKLKMLESLI